MIPNHEREYEACLLYFIEEYGREEEFNRAKRQHFEARLKPLLDTRRAERLKSGCPPAFLHDCILMDGTRCPYYHDDQCVKVEEETI